MIKGIGTDIIEIERIRQAISRWGDHFVDHVFNKEEIKYARQNKDPIQHFAARFAAKEAVYKAISNRKISWKDITILNDKNGRPYCRITDPKIKSKILISISHTKNYAVANAIISS